MSIYRVTYTELFPGKLQPSDEVLKIISILLQEVDNGPNRYVISSYKWMEEDIQEFIYDRELTDIEKEAIEYARMLSKRYEGEEVYIA